MLLAIDVGNSRTKFGFHDGQEWVLVDDVETEILFDKVVATTVLERMVLAVSRPAIAAVATVVPGLMPALNAASKQLKVDSKCLSASEVPWLRIGYGTPETLGADRLANALYLHEQGQFPAISVDFGTATKLDVIDPSGAYVGGAILPGAKMMIEGLASGTAQLPSIELKAPDHAIGRSTVECIQSGTVLALAKAVEGLVEHMKRELGEKAGIPVEATGGLAPLMAPLCPGIQEVVPNLTLEGLLIAARRWSESR